LTAFATIRNGLAAALVFATSPERQELLPHLIEVVEIRPGTSSDAGAYELRLSPSGSELQGAGAFGQSAKNCRELTAVRSTDEKAPRQGGEHHAYSSKKTTISKTRAAHSGVNSADFVPDGPPDDSDLAIIINRWPLLPDAAKAKVLAIISRGCGDLDE
jgi:hypothetical protein